MGLAWQGDGRVVVSEYDAGTVAEVDAETGQVLRRLSVGPSLWAWRRCPRKGLVVVCDYGLHAVAIVDLKTGRERSDSSCGRHPYFVTVTPDEALAVVGNLIPAGPAMDPVSSAVISLIDLDTGKNLKNIPLPASSSNVRQVRVSADGLWVYVVHTQGRTTLPTTQVERGWINTNALSIIDLTGKELYATVLLDTINEGGRPVGDRVGPRRQNGLGQYRRRATDRQDRAGTTPRIPRRTGRQRGPRRERCLFWCRRRLAEHQGERQ